MGVSTDPSPEPCMTRPKYEHPYRSGDWPHEIYPMPAFPTLIVTDVERSSRWYQDTLGFVDVFTMRRQDGTPLLAHLRWCRFGDVLLTTGQTPVEEPRGQGITLNFSAEEVDTLGERVRAAGATIAEGPIDRPWNTRDLTLRDPDGYTLNFTAPQDAMLQRVVAGEAPSMDEIVARLRGRS
jgi:catechol 2,3-dioxygenase-like lactoylglutathione lyase family enzyme